MGDNMAIYKKDLVQRELNYAIIDEVDSVLIDEARTPLIISGDDEISTDLYKTCETLACMMVKGTATGELSKVDAIVGNNIEEGIYNLHALSGNGNLYIKNSKGRLKVNILLGVGNEYNTKNNIYLKDYNNVTLEKDDVITIGKDMKVKFNAIK